jgi:hypothetical protein
MPLPEGYSLYDMIDERAGMPYGPYLFSETDVTEVTEMAANHDIKVVPHECDDPDVNGECGHMLAGIPPVY